MTLSVALTGHLRWASGLSTFTSLRGGVGGFPCPSPSSLGHLAGSGGVLFARRGGAYISLHPPPTEANGEPLIRSGSPSWSGWEDGLEPHPALEGKLWE